MRDAPKTESPLAAPPQALLTWPGTGAGRTVFVRPGGDEGTSAMGRRETPVDPSAGPVQRFAYELRKLRREAGPLTYREMTRRAHYSVTSLSQAAAGGQLPSLAVTLAYVTACGGDPEDWERRWRETAREASVRDREDDDAEPPYQGLARFEPDDHERFFGRDELTGAVRGLVTERRFAAVFGPSGSGKSSLLRAGLVPALRRHTGGTLAAIRILAPGEHPVRTHADALTPRDGADGDTVLVVDQFEEVFTLCRDPAERAEFIDLLLASRDPASRLRVIIAVRADFYGRCAEHRELTDALRDASLLVGPMSPAELREAVVRPAQAAGLIVERSLTARLVGEVEGQPGGLPLLSHVLRETWRRRRGRALTEEAYLAAGGLNGAIAQTAEDIHARLSARQAELARLILLRLITPGEGSQDTRRPAERAELDIAAPDDVSLVLDRLAQARLLTLDDDTVSLAHEALITAWPRLSGWIEEDRERLHAHRRLTDAARGWDELGRDPGTLFRGVRLTAAEEFFGGPDSRAALTPLEGAFFTASRTARTRERRRRRGLVSALSVLLSLALVAGVIAWQQSRTSDRRQVEAEARRLAAVADSMRFSDPVRAMRLSVAAWRLARTTETRSALFGSLVQKEEDTFTLPDGGDAGAAGHHLTRDGQTLMSITPQRIETWDVRTHRRTGTYPGYGKRLGENDSLVPAPDGRMLALLKEGGVQLWDVRRARVAATLKGATPMEAAFSDDGRILVVEDWGDDIEDAMDVRVWDLRQRKQLMHLPLGESESLQATDASPDRNRLALCTDERGLEIWDIGKRRVLPLPWVDRLRGDDHCIVGGFVLAPDSKRIALATATGVEIRDLLSGRVLTPRLDAQGGLGDIRFSADGAFLAATTYTREILLWRLTAPDAPVFRHPLISESPSELRLDIAGGFMRYATVSGRSVRSLSLGGAVTGRWQAYAVGGAMWSEDGRTLATLHRTSDGDGFELLDGRDGSEVAELPGKPCDPQEAEEPSQDPEEADAPQEPEGRPDGPEDADESDGDTEEGLKAGTTVGTRCSDLMAMSADGGYFAYGRFREPNGDGGSAGPQRVTVWDVRAQRPHATLAIGPRRDAEDVPVHVSGIALSPDGRTLAVSFTTLSETLELWDVRKGERLRTLGDFSGSEMAFSPEVTRSCPGRTRPPICGRGE